MSDLREVFRNVYPSKNRTHITECQDFVGSGGRIYLFGPQDLVEDRVEQLKEEFKGPYEGHVEANQAFDDGNIGVTFRWFGAD